MATFLDAVNRILRIEGIIRGDDDNITSFSSSQHAAAIEVAQISVQEELASLSEDLDLPYERTTGTLSLFEDSRTYAMPSDFMRFTEEERMYPVRSGSVDSDFIKGADESKIRMLDPGYENTSGTPSWFYFIGATTTQVGFYPVPDSGNDGDIYKFWYDESINVTAATDTVPVITTEQFNAFASQSARKFKFLRLNPQERNALFPQGVEQDPVLESKRATTIRLLNMRERKTRYGRQYG